MPLTGIRVVDLTRVLSGPYCSMFLADMGADVIKVETPDGDSVRRQGAMRDGFSWYFASFNRNKRSIAIDLRAAAGNEILAKLIAGLQGALGVCAALVQRGRTGRGEQVGASLTNGLISFLAYLSAEHFETG